MYLRRDQADALFQSSLSEVSSRLFGHIDFVTELLKGDDWSLAIKAQALVEACVTQALLIRLDDERIRKTVEVMPLVGGEVSKLQFAKDLQVLDAPQRRFAKRLAALRNRLAHRIDCVNFSFSEYIESLGKNERQDWQDSIIWFGTDAASRELWLQMALKQPRFAVIMGVFMLAAVLVVEDNQTSLKRAIDVASFEATSELLRSLKNVG